MKPLRTATAICASVALLVTASACGGADASDDDPSGTSADNSSVKRADPGGAQDIPSYTGLDDSQLGEPLESEPWSLDAASGSAMTTAKLNDEPVLLSGTRKGDVELYGIDGDMRESYSLHDEPIIHLHVAHVDGEMMGVSVEIGDDGALARVWDLANGEAAGDIDMGSDYDFTKVVRYDDKPVFVNGAKEVKMTDLASLETIEHYEYDLGMAAQNGDVVDVDGDTVLVADNVVGGNYGVGAWNLDNGSGFHDYPMYEHSGNSVNDMASGYLDETVLAVTGDHGGDIKAWDVSGNEEYGPGINPDSSSVTSLAVVELDETLVGIAGTLDRTLLLWDVKTGETIEELETSAGINHLEMTEVDGRPAFLAGGDGWAMPYALG